MENKISLVVCGINHRTASLEIRQPIQISREDLPRANRLLGTHEEIFESVILATCNRIEFYMVAKPMSDYFRVIENFYSKFASIHVNGLREKFYIKKDRHAADHLFRVAAGIDSMVLGESQIQGQVKEAYTSACNVKTAGKILHRLFHQAFRVGKQTRTDTELGRGACSVSSASVEMLKGRLEKIDNPLILLIGVNQTIALAASALNRLGYTNLIFANRTKSKADQLAAQYQASGHSLSELPFLLEKADIAISCTSAKEPLITQATLSEIADRNPSKKLVIMDMAVPRDFALDKSFHPRIELLDLDDVKDFIKAANQARMQAVVKVEEIIERRLDEFIYWYDHVRHEPTYNGLENKIEELMHTELSNLYSRIPADHIAEFESALKRYSMKLIKLKINSET